jgi:RNA polymerase sigma-70 factor (ECF subfamily)
MVVAEHVDFGALAEPYRRELLAHCYRMLGSVHDAEDMVQETYVRAWRAYGQFEGRSSLRTWLYRIATTTCLRALETRRNRPLPSGIGGPSSDPEGPVHLAEDLSWLEPLPGSLETSPDPASLFVEKESVRLALIAALQHLTPRSRAVLILRDVLRWRAAEVAELLGTSAAAVNSALQRAREQLKSIAPAPDQLTEPHDPAVLDLLKLYADAFERADIPALTQLLHEDATFEMPPFSTWFRSRANVSRFFGLRIAAAGLFRMIPLTANGQPAFAMYERSKDGSYRAHSLQVLSVDKAGVREIVQFMDHRLFDLFELPPIRSAASLVR